MARSFNFGRDQQPQTPEERARARAAANSLLANQQTPTDIGSGLNAIGRATLYRELVAQAEAPTGDGPAASPVTRANPVAQALGLVPESAPAAGGSQTAEAQTVKPAPKHHNPELPSRFDFLRPSDLTFKRVIKTGPGWTTIETADGQVIRREGDRNWRNNNPGNMEYGPFSRRNGAIGSDGRFSIFPTLEAGRLAQERRLFETPKYANKTLAEAIASWAPKVENNTEKYINTVANRVGVSRETVLSTLTAEQRAAVIAEMRRYEGFHPGQQHVFGAAGPQNLPFDLPQSAPIPEPRPAAQDAIGEPSPVPSPYPAPDPERFGGNPNTAPDQQMLQQALRDPVLLRRILSEIQGRPDNPDIFLPQSAPRPGVR